MSGKFFDIDGPLVQGVNSIIDLVVLNLLTVLCCIPVVTAGASIAAMNSVALKIVRNEECYIGRMFFKAFRENLKIGILSTIVIILLIALGMADFYAIGVLDVWFASVARVLLCVFAILFIMTLTFLFPVMAKFEAGVTNTFKNAFKFSVSHILYTIGMFAINIIPWVIVYFVNVLAPLLFIIGLSFPAVLDARIYNESFKKIEESYHAGKPVQP